MESLLFVYEITYAYKKKKKEQRDKLLELSFIN